MNYKMGFGWCQIPKSVYSTRYQVLIQILREAREATGISQERLATKLGKPQSYVSKIELCERQINVVELAEWCEAIEVPLIEFIERWQQAAKK